MKRRKVILFFLWETLGNSKTVGSILIILKLKIASYVVPCKLEFTEGLGEMFSPISLVQVCIVFRGKDCISVYPFVTILAEFTQASENR